LPFPAPENLTVATTGASGSIFLKHFLLTVERDPRVKTVNFIASDSGLRVLAEELGVEGRSDLLRQIIGAASAKIQPQSNSDIGANVASGSYPSDAMVVIPMQRRHARPHCQRHGFAPHRARRRCES
jgi:4-hydroxy-3-polyprenylbenzoate decarboxylase